MNNFRIIFILFFIYISTIFITVNISRLVFTSYHRAENIFGEAITSSIYELSEFGKSLYAFFNTPEYFIVNDESKNFLELTDTINIDSKILYSYKQSRNRDIIELVDLNNNSIIKSWMPDSKAIDQLSFNTKNRRTFKPGQDLNLYHPILIENDSSVVLNSGYSLIKVNSDNSINWVNNEIEFHHSINKINDSTLVVAGRPFKSIKLPFMEVDYESYSNIYLDDSIYFVNINNGNVEYSKSVTEILLENNLIDILLNNGKFSFDQIHLNDIQPVLVDGEYWKKGDLFLSVRDLSLVFLYRPSSKEIIWYKQGPWLNQHDVDIINKETVSVFDNNMVMGIRTINVDTKILDGYTIEGNNRIYYYNFKNDSLYTMHDDITNSNNIKTYTGGIYDKINDNLYFIDNQESGILYFFNNEKVLGKFSRRLDSNNIVHLNWPRLYK
mgnify:CR=1 FL=1|tara:strand:- start:4719 stop:6038 length:1320 start_codon:yes stop_codon:yes gene_type:complete